VAPDVIAGCEDVGAGSEKFLGELRSDAQAVRDVLRIDDAEVCVQLVP
jgi:hypothetical protein